MDDTLLQVASLLPWLPIAVAVLGGIWALRRVRQAPVVHRAERAIAIRLAAALAALASLGTIALVPASNPVGGPIILFLILGVVLAAAGFVFLSALFGYVVLARSRLGAIALVGITVGPLLLGGTTALAMAWKQDLQNAPYRAAAAAREKETAERSRAVHVSVDDVRVSTTSYRDPALGHDVQIVEAVRLTMFVRVDHDIRFPPGSGFARDALVTLWPPVAGVALTGQTAAEPAPLMAGRDVRFAMVFTYIPVKFNDTLLRALSEPGVWSLELRFRDAQQLDYVVEVPVTLATIGPS
jgi:hypothetical protein